MLVIIYGNVTNISYDIAVHWIIFLAMVNE